MANGEWRIEYCDKIGKNKFACEDKTREKDSAIVLSLNWIGWQNARCYIRRVYYRITFPTYNFAMASQDQEPPKARGLGFVSIPQMSEELASLDSNNLLGGKRTLEESQDDILSHEISGLSVGHERSGTFISSPNRRESGPLFGNFREETIKSEPQLETKNLGISQDFNFVFKAPNKRELNPYTINQIEKSIQFDPQHENKKPNDSIDSQKSEDINFVLKPPSRRQSLLPGNSESEKSPAIPNAADKFHDFQLSRIPESSISGTPTKLDSNNKDLATDQDKISNATRFTEDSPFLVSPQQSANLINKETTRFMRTIKQDALENNQWPPTKRKRSIVFLFLSNLY
ncbi:hypothetical protein G9A89_017894 [Geosiphon pyriformis]|nr:hypothetical protein G9A89_017894 [Geosiphon pyriformis]